MPIMPSTNRMAGWNGVLVRKQWPQVPSKTDNIDTLQPIIQYKLCDKNKLLNKALAQRTVEAKKDNENIRAYFCFPIVCHVM